MSVAKSLGVDDINAPNMRELRAEWPRWRQMSSDLPDVDDLKDLQRWMQDAEPTQRDEVLTALRRIAEGDRRAYVVLAWLLMPGASRIAGRIRRLTDAIDEIVAGQLWVQICEHDPADDRYVAKKILDRVCRESMAELGVGDLAKRRDEAWTMTVLVDTFDESMPAGPADDEVVSKEVLANLLQRGIDSGKLAEGDRDLLLDLAHAAEQIDAPSRRGRGGLMTPSVTQLVEESQAMSSRSIRRHAAGALAEIRREAERGVWRCEPSALGRQEGLHAFDGFGEGRQVLVNDRLHDLWVGCEVVVGKEVPHAGDFAPADVGLGAGDIDAQRLHAFTDLEETHGHSVHHDLDTDWPML